VRSDAVPQASMLDVEQPPRKKKTPARSGDCGRGPDRSGPASTILSRSPRLRFCDEVADLLDEAIKERVGRVIARAVSS
jgi:hypothetical protein